MPTLDEAIRALPEILDRLERIEALLTKAPVPVLQPTKLLYDVDDLCAEGLGKDEAYRILRRYCQKIAGRRLRITHEQLMDYYSSREDNNG